MNSSKPISNKNRYKAPMPIVTSQRIVRHNRPINAGYS